MGGDPGCGRTECPLRARAPPTPQGRSPRAVPGAPANSVAEPAPRHPRSAQLTKAGLGSRRPRWLFPPRRRRALHAPAGRRPAPWPWHPAGAAARLPSPGRAADRPQLPGRRARARRERWAPERDPKRRAHGPSAGARWSWRGARLCLPAPCPARRPRPRRLRYAWLGEVRAAEGRSEGGAGLGGREAAAGRSGPGPSPAGEGSWGAGAALRAEAGDPGNEPGSCFRRRGKGLSFCASRAFTSLFGYKYLTTPTPKFFLITVNLSKLKNQIESDWVKLLQM